MTEHAFIASDLEARGLHAGTITAVVRPIVPQPERDLIRNAAGSWRYMGWDGIDSDSPVLHCPFGQPGDVLAVKETFRTEGIRPAIWWSCAIRMKANDAVHVTEFDEYELWQRYPLGKWQSPAVMPREFVQLGLTVQGVRAVRVQELREPDILALGIVPTWRRNDGRLHTYYEGWADDQARAAFAPWWDARWGKRYPHDSNPWLWLGMVRKGAE